ncbi:GNAT family N-acetyltransferase [Aquabacterium sp.]|uniref:GNAT family N-acetyltransferase n=1 Tax=Aquabacterium sp. TaxID=1872578 RepID=UPI0037836B1A
MSAPPERPPRPSAKPTATRARVTLAPLTPADEADFLQAVAASRRLHGPWVAPPATPERYRTLMKYLAGPANAGFLVRRTDTQALVGVYEITNIVRGLPQHRAGHERQGLMRGLAPGRAAFGAMKPTSATSRLPATNARA